MNQNYFGIRGHTILIWSFYFQVSLGLIDIVLHKPAQYGLPSNSGWILILGLLTIINELENG